MAVPKKKTSVSKRNMRRSHHALKQPTHIIDCPQCSEPIERHRVCGNDECGFYRGKQVIVSDFQ